MQGRQQHVSAIPLTFAYATNHADMADYQPEVIKHIIDHAAVQAAYMQHALWHIFRSRLMSGSCLVGKIYLLKYTTQ